MGTSHSKSKGKKGRSKQRRDDGAPLIEDHNNNPNVITEERNYEQSHHHGASEYQTIHTSESKVSNAKSFHLENQNRLQSETQADAYSGTDIDDDDYDDDALPRDSHPNAGFLKNTSMHTTMGNLPTEGSRINVSLTRLNGEMSLQRSTSTTDLATHRSRVQSASGNHGSSWTLKSSTSQYIGKSVSRFKDITRSILEMATPAEKISLLMQTDAKGTPCLFDTLNENNTEHLEQCLSGLEKQDILKLLKIQDRQGRTIVHWAMVRAKADIIEFILGYITPAMSIMLLRMTDEMDRSVLHEAVDEGPVNNASVMSILYKLLPRDRIALLRIRDDLRGYTPLDIAVAKQNGDVIDIILTSLSNSDKTTILSDRDRCGKTVLHRAACDGKFDILKRVFELTPNKQELLSQTDEAGNTVLHAIVQGITKDADLEILLEGVDNTQLFKLMAMVNSNGSSVLHSACGTPNAAFTNQLINLLHENPTKMIELLQKQNNALQTPLHLAAHHKNIVEGFLQLCNDRQLQLKLLNIRDDTGCTALHCAAVHCNAQLLNYILDLSARPVDKFNQVLVKDSSENTVLHVAAEAGCHEIIERVFEVIDDSKKVAVMKQINKFGLTIVHLIAQRGDVACVAKLFSSIGPSDRRQLLAYPTSEDKTAVHLLLSTRDFSEDQALGLIHVAGRHLKDLLTIKDLNERTAASQLVDSNLVSLFEEYDRFINSAYWLEFPPTVLLICNTTGREGAEDEMNAIRAPLIEEGMNVILKINLNGNDILKAIDAAKLQTKSALLVLILSHGSEGCVHGNDSQPLPIQNILDTCSVGLNGIPKVVILQCCQGSNIRDLSAAYVPVFAEDVNPNYSEMPKNSASTGITGTAGSSLITCSSAGGTASSSGATADQNEVTNIQFNLLHDDLAILLSTLSGDIAIRSVFIPIFAERFTSAAQEDDIYSVFLSTSNEMKGLKPRINQTPYIKSTLRKQLRLKSKFWRWRKR